LTSPFIRNKINDLFQESLFLKICLPILYLLLIYMMKISRGRVWLLLPFFIWLGNAPRQNQSVSSAFPEFRHYPMEAKRGYESLYVPPPPTSLRSPRHHPAGSGFSFQWNPVGCRADYTSPNAKLLPWPADAKTALQAATGIMESLLLIRVPIEIQACWWDSMGGYLGTGGPLGYGGGSGFPMPTARYPSPLAKQIGNSAPLPGVADLEVNFNGSTGWYFGTNGQPVGGIDFMTVALHELTHGLGFIGNMTWSYNVARCGDFMSLYCPTPYDNLAVDPLGNSLVAYISINPVTVAGFLTSEAYLKGTELLARNGGQPARLYTPSYWERSSYSHLDDSVQSINYLMRPSIGGGSAIHHPGPIVLGLFKDMGWVLLDQGPFVQLSGPAMVQVGATASFTAVIWPQPASGSATYTWNISDHPTVINSHSAGSDTVSKIWTLSGTKDVGVSVVYSGQTLTASRQVTALQLVHLPLIIR
jgi:hypothetical protein